MRPNRWMGIVAAVFVLGLVLAACSSSDSGGSSGGTGATSGGTTATSGSSGTSGATASSGSTGTASGGTAITIQNFTFEPSSLAVNGKATITVTNDDTTTHTFTADDGSFDETVSAGQSVTVKVDVTQDTPYHCKIHPTMTGTLTAG